MNTPTNPVIIIVGGSGGIGSAVARRLSARNCRVILAARDADRLHAVASEMDAESIPLDARDSAAVDAMMKSVNEEHGRIDGLVNCAGSILLKPAHLLSDQDINDLIASFKASHAS